MQLSAADLRCMPDEKILERRRACRDLPVVKYPHESERLLEELFQRYQGRVRAWCLQLTGDPSAASDLVQDVFLKALVRLDSFRGEAKFSTWLYAIARNLHIDQIRASIVRGEVAFDVANQDVVYGESGPQEVIPRVAGCDPAPRDPLKHDPLKQLEQQDTQRQLEAAMRGLLTATEYRVLDLHYAHEIPLSRISQLLKLGNASGAKSYLLSAQRKLCRKFSGSGSRYSPGGLRTRSVNHQM